MSRDDGYLFDILDSARIALEYMKGKKQDEFTKDPMLQDAVVRRLEIIGEAASRVSAETQAKYPHLPWTAMKGTRNRVIHEYDSVELEIIWDIVEMDLPALVAELEMIVPAKKE
ncbi:MAG: DUF86 domain-containing protein [Anaerolineales bacterium]|nr:DUF86 domain-containing protein [Anaerolineales bacterium]